MADNGMKGTDEKSSARPVDPAALKPRPPRSKNPRRLMKTPEEAEIQRRDFVWYSFAGWFTALIVCFCRYFFPRALFEPSTTFKVGFPEEFGFGVDTKFQQKYRVWVCRNAAGLYVIFARCTHLGCTPDWKPAENKFKCPCHGSGFDSEGINFEGPAPQPMLRCHLELSPVGEIVVDKLNLYTYPQFKEAKPASEGPLLAV